MKQLSLHVVGANHPNADGSNRRFEILLCVPGEPIELVPEPKNPVDPSAIAVVSARHVQIGYLTADRAPWIGSMLRNGRELQAVFQGATQPGAAIRIGFDGEAPVLPECGRKRHAAETTEEVDFWPDELPPDD
ncbi:HIRAN domain-containing protein [Sphingomonas sp. NPDC079357]|uniref:HIRAN domain-containing protein n=1 Tax=Sphingomonas sp. NPDC079357 TaxID=3364518 RepID=UPI003851534B